MPERTIPNVCRDCPAGKLGCKILEPETGVGTKVIVVGRYLSCIHFTCEGAGADAARVAKKQRKKLYVAQRKLRLLKPFGSDDKPTAKQHDLPRNMRNHNYAGQRKAYIRARAMFNETPLPTRYVDRHGKIYSTNRSGEILQTGQKV